jgi:hypothetical protein
MTVHAPKLLTLEELASLEVAVGGPEANIPASHLNSWWRSAM